MIQTPHTLVNLPVSLHASQSKTFAADVHTLVGSRKRKRPELAVALDHEGVNIYDVHSTNNILCRTLLTEHSRYDPPGSQLVTPYLHSARSPVPLVPFGADQTAPSLLSD